MDEKYQQKNPAIGVTCSLSYFKEICFLHQSGLIFCISPPLCQVGSLYGIEFRIAFDLKHILPCGDERISALSFDCEGGVSDF